MTVCLTLVSSRSYEPMEYAATSWTGSSIFSRVAKQRVTVNGKLSAWAIVLSGIPHGSVLGPILFVIFINYLPDYMHMAFIRVPDGLIWHKSPTSGRSRVATRARCWWRMPDEANCHHWCIARWPQTYYRSLVLIIISLKLARKCQIMTNICCIYT